MCDLNPIGRVLHWSKDIVQFLQPQLRYVIYSQYIEDHFMKSHDRGLEEVYRGDA
jgi:hypothetical protein